MDKKIQLLEYLRFFASGDKTKNDFDNFNHQTSKKEILDELFLMQLVKIKGIEYHSLSEGVVYTYINNLHDSRVIYLTPTGYLFLKEHVSSKGVLLDSNIFDDLFSGALSIELLEKSIQKGYAYYVTHLQIDEINNCIDSEKRAKLVLFKTKLRPTVIATESFILGTSRLGFAKLGDAEILEKIRNGDRKRTNDALIGETAIKNHHLLITNDAKLKKEVNENGGTALSSVEFRKLIS